jgi:hypothetical protein
VRQLHRHPQGRLRFLQRLRLGGDVRLTALIKLGALALCASTSFAPARGFSQEKASGSTIRDTGLTVSTNDKSFNELSIKFYVLDKKLKVLTTEPPKNISQAQFNALLQARDLAERDFSESREYLIQTSGQGLPRSKQQELSYWVASIDNGLKADSPRDQVNTRISYSGADATNVALHFRTHAQRQANDPSWSSYSGPAVMKVGTYEFRVMSLRGQPSPPPCYESVLVVNDPTEKTVCSGYRP